jgi:hypothetical protein
MAPDLAGAGHLVSALPLNELQAETWQGDMLVALVPNADPMVLTNNTPDLAKLNAYRAGVDQSLVQDSQASSTRTYCQHLLDITPARLQVDALLTRQAPPADPAVANSLFTFLAQRFVTSYTANELNCAQRLNQADPITVQTDANGVAVDAMIAGGATLSPVTTASMAAGGPDCSINGTVLPDCAGAATVNGQTCAFTFDANARKITITCPAGQ